MSTYSLGTLGIVPIKRDNYTVTTAESTDVFGFNVNNGNQINLALTDLQYGDADLRLYRDSNGNGTYDSGDAQIASSLDSGTNDDAININASSGTYFAVVNRYSGTPATTVRYDLQLSATPPPTSAGFSNLLPIEQQHGNLYTDVTTYGSVGDLNTTDVHAFSLDSYEKVDIRLSGLSADADIRLIRDSNNNRVVDVGEVIGSSTRGSNYDELISNVRGAGNYYLQVYQYRGDTNYQLTLDHSYV